MSTELSLGELASLTTKALRGAGYPWGLADDGGHAARVLAANALPAMAVVARWLEHVESRSVPDLIELADDPESDAPQGREVCPIALGAALSDLGTGWSGAMGSGATGSDPGAPGPLPMHNCAVLQPLLVGPALESALVEWSGGSLQVSGGAIRLRGRLPLQPTVLSLREAGPLPAIPMRTRCRTSGADLDTVERLASRTYAPPSDASRAQAGAD